MVANLLIFINAHLASGNANEVAVIASHNKRTAWLYPSTAPVTSHHTSNQNGTTSQTQNANKYQPFYEVETNLLGNLDKLLKTTTEEDLSTPTTQIAGALSTALSYINKSTIRHSPVDPTLFESHAILVDDGNLTSSRINLVSRILVLSVSGDLASQYIPVMNAIFAAQRQRIPIDILKLAGDTVLLQQACDATGGIYMAPESPEGLLQYLMMAFLPDATGRKMLVLPSAGSVDFRAACFCHRNVVDIGFVCSVCLSSTYFFHSSMSFKR
jgi:transcription initiation factor TFIIH subunit 3